MDRKARMLRSNGTKSSKSTKKADSTESPSSRLSTDSQNYDGGHFPLNEIRKIISEEMIDFSCKLMIEIDSIRDAFSHLSDSVKETKISLARVQESQKRQDSDILALKMKVDSLEKMPLDGIVSEMDDRFSRKSNIIIRGMPEPEGNSLSDMKQKEMANFHELLDQAKTVINSSIEMRRLGKVDKEKPRLLKIQFECRKDRDNVLRNSKLLRKTRFNNVFVDPDRTPSQQKEHRALIEEMKERRSRNEDVVIRGNRVVPREMRLKNPSFSHFHQGF